MLARYKTEMTSSSTTLLLTAVFVLVVSNATLQQDKGCTLAPTYGWVEEKCKGGYAIRCNRLGLKDIPTQFPRYANSSRPCLLDLSENTISHIKNHSFINISEIKFLFLFDNKISRIDADAFVNLTNLLFLNLTGNRLRNPDSFGEGVFDPLVNLNLTFVSLKNNSLEPGEYLINLLSPLKYIEFLDMSYNENLTFEGMKYVLKGLANVTVNAINLKHIHEYFEMGTKLKLEDIKPMRNIRNVTRIFLDLNKIEVLEEGIFDLLSSYSTLEEIGIGGNRLTYGKYMEHLYKMKHVKKLYLSRQHSNVDPFYRQHFEERGFFEPEVPSFQQANIQQRGRYMKFQNGNDQLQAITACRKCKKQCPQDTICICIPPKLEKVEWKKSYIELQVHKVKVCEPSNLKILDVSFNLITEWNGPVKGLEHLENLNLAENYCQKLGPFFFYPFHGLRSLNLSYNFLGPMFSNFTEKGVHYFRNLTRLDYLDLTENRITLLPANTFENLKSLKYLNLSRNMMSEWKNNLRANCLRKLDLTGNKLEYLPPSLRNYLDKTENLPSTETCNTTEPVTVLLSGNPLRCNCDNRPFLRWLATSRVIADFHDNIECHLKDGKPLKLTNRLVVSDLVKRLDKECFPYVSIIVSTCMFVVGIAVCVLIYRSRWKLRYWYYKKRHRHRNVGYERLFDRDAFISYASSESRFIKRFLVPAVEEQHGVKVWVADRDSIPGVSIAENLANAIGSSKKTVLILSRRYFKEDWCGYEMNLARMETIETHRKLMIIVLFEDMAANEIPLEYQRLLKSEEFLEYPTDPQYNDTFWEALCSAILRE